MKNESESKFACLWSGSSWAWLPDKLYKIQCLYVTSAKIEIINESSKLNLAYYSTENCCALCCFSYFENTAESDQSNGSDMEYFQVSRPGSKMHLNAFFSNKAWTNISEGFHVVDDYNTVADGE